MSLNDCWFRATRACNIKQIKFEADERQLELATQFQYFIETKHLLTMLNAKMSTLHCDLKCLVCHTIALRFLDTTLARASLYSIAYQKL